MTSMYIVTAGVYIPIRKIRVHSNLFLSSSPADRLHASDKRSSDNVHIATRIPYGVLKNKV